MIKAKIPLNEADRLQALRSFDILDTGAEEQLDDIVLLASQICGTPFALVSLVDENRQWFKARHGIETTETPRDIAFCAHAIHETQTFIVENALVDERFRDNPFVAQAPNVRFYAGALLTTSDGYNIGTLCVLDSKPKQISEAQKLALEALARQVIVNFERRKLENQLRSREVFLSNIMSALPSLVSFISPNFKYLYANDVYERWFDRKIDQVIGEKMENVIGEAAFKVCKPHLIKALGGTLVDYQADLPCQIGGHVSLKSIQVHYIPAFGEDGKVEGIYSIETDITALRQAEIAAHEQSRRLTLALEQASKSEKSFRAIFEYSPLGIIQVDSKYRYVLVNDAFCRFLGYTEAELKQMTILDVTHPEDVETTKEAISKFAKDFGQIQRFEKRYLTKSGQEVWGLVSSRSVQYTEQGESYLFSIIEDITEYKRRELEYQTTQAKMFASSRLAELGEMAGGIAHEINNPLAIIQGKVGILLRQLESPNPDFTKIKSDLGKISDTTQRIAKIVRGLRAFSRDSENDPMAPASLRQIVADTLELCNERMKYENIEIRTNSIPEIAVECRSTQLGQVILNLINNSHDAIIDLQDRWISIEAVVQDERVVIRVTDSGHGISEEVVQKMMQPFFTTKEVGKGTGLGLSIAKGIIENHNGRLYYDPDAKNTSFVIELPAIQKAKQNNESRVAS
jgi:PAS domain S-box-containing protein